MSAVATARSFLRAKPFGEGPSLLFSGWFQAARLFVERPMSEWRSKDFVSCINDCFVKLSKTETFHNPHLLRGRYGTIRRVRQDGKSDELTRHYLLLLNDFSKDQVVESIAHSTIEQSDPFNRPRQLLFSPLYFVRRMLTSPEYAASAAYSHAVIRADIFAAALAWPVNRPQTGKAQDAIRKIIAFEQVARSVHKAEAYRQNGDTFHMADQTDLIVGHLLASMGMAYYSFAPGEVQYTSKRKHERPIIGRSRFLLDESLVPSDGTYELRFIDELVRLPSASEIINLLDGIPIPIPGANTIFAGGIRVSHERGVVARVSGVSGTGKTTFALGIASALAPLGTRTCYLSCEEDPRELAHRILTLTPPFLPRMSSFQSELDKWFAAVHLNSVDPEENRSDALAFVEYVCAEARREEIDLPRVQPPGVVPLLVVLDGVHELISRPPQQGKDEIGEMRQLVETFRRLGVFVIILTAQTDDSALKELDYLVDVVITLEHENRTNIAEEPKRKLVLHKTRLQYSWPGAHHLHLSKRDGVKLYPQLPAQLEPYIIWRWKPILTQSWYDILQTGVPTGEDAGEPAPLVRIFERSQILLAGRGSAGKAGFAIKLLSSPLLRKDRRTDTDELFSQRVSGAFRRRLLVASFLYPEEYYASLLKRIERSSSDRLSFEQPNVELDTLSFYPGFIPAEVLLAKILNRIMAADLEGAPYHGVIIDGLHNVFLQFPHLQHNVLFWPVLYETFRTLGLSVVTTHTQFSLRGMDSMSTLTADVETVTNRIGPLLQALVNAADFYINITSNDDLVGAAFIELVSAINQPARRLPYFWNPQALLVEYRKRSAMPNA